MNKHVNKIFSVVTILALMLMALPMQIAGAVSTTVVISQFQVAGATAADEFVELHNIGTTSIDLNGYRLVYRSATGTTDVNIATWTASTVIPAGGYYLIAAALSGTTPVGYDDGVAPDLTFTHSGTGSFAAAGGGFALRNGPTNTGTIIDSVGYGTATNSFVESAATTVPGANASKMRKATSCQDTDNNSNDFDTVNPSTPRNTASPSTSCGSEATDPKINEFSANTAGTDVEYVEIYGDPSTDYSAYTVLEIESDAGTSAGTVDEVVALGTTDANGLYLVNLVANSLENGSITLLLVKNFTGALNDDLDTNDDGTFETTPWESIVDAVAVNDGGATDPSYGVPVLGVSYDGQPFAPGGASRIPDGADTDAAADWVRNDFDLAGIPGFTGTAVEGEAYNTPGAANEAVPPPVPQLVINEVDYDQPSTDNAEFVEIRNNGTSAVALSGWSLEFVNGTGGVLYDTIMLPAVSLAAGDYFVVCANAATVANCDLDDSPDTNFIQNGSPDAIALRFNGGLVDTVSYAGDTVAPYTEGSGVGLADSSTAGQSISRCPDGTDTQVNNVDFTLVGSTPGAANDCGSATPQLTINDVSLNEGNAGTTTFTFTVSLSVPAGAGGVTFDIATADNTATVANNDYAAQSLTGQTISAGNTTYNFDVTVNGDATPEPDETFFVNVTNVTGAALVDGQGQGTIVNDDGIAVTPIHDIQTNDGSSAAGTFTVEAIVVGDYQTQGSGQLRGFFLQEEDADVDADAATSEGIFVFCSSCSVAVSVGDKVRVTGASSEFNNMTQLSATTVASVTVLSSGNPLPTPASIQLPVPGVPSDDLAAATAAINAYYEAFEGMLVTYPDTLSVSEYFELARYGQVILTEGGRPHTFTAVNTPTASGFINHEIDLASRTVILDDTDNIENRPVATSPNTPYYYPTPGLSTGNFFRGGDTITNLTGVLHWSFAGGPSQNTWRIRPVTEAYNYAFTPTNLRPAVPEVDGRLTVASFNVLNYFLTLDTSNTCAPTQNQDCRGADSAQELERQRTKMLAALSEIDADVFGFMEMENTPGVEPLADIVAGLPGYDYIDTGVIGTDAIRVGIIYKTSAVTPVGDYAILDSSVDPRFVDTRNRPALAQTFEENATGARFTAVVNHLKSKGSGCGPGDDDTTTGQGNCTGTRTLAAEALADWLATDPTDSGDSDVLIIGDLNSYAKEDPIVALQDAGYTDLVAAFGGPSAYGYVFDGQLGYLDHALSNPSLTSQVADVAEWHINADEIPLFDYNDDQRTADEASFEEESDTLPLYEPNEFRTSDHDPVIIGLNLDVPDNVAPETTIDSSPSNPSNSSSASFTFSGTDDTTAPGNLTFECDLDGNGFSSCTSPQNYTSLADGNHTFQVRAIDEAGNVDPTPASFTWTIDTVAPTISVAAGGMCTSSGGTMNLTVADASSVNLSGSSSNTTAVPNANIVFGGSGADRTVTITAVAGSTVRTATVTITASDGVNTASTTITVTVGTSGNNTTLNGTSGADLILGLGGNDKLSGLSGNDLLCGGSGNDTLDGGDDDDTLDGDSGNDTLNGGNGNDSLSGGDNNDILNGDAGNDSMSGDSGNDTLTGGANADFFSGGTGNDKNTDFNAGQGDTNDGT